MKIEYLCPECKELWDPKRGMGPYGESGVKDGVPFNRELGIMMTCGNSHSWKLPGKTMLEIMADFPALAPGYIHTMLADAALRKIGL